MTLLYLGKRGNLLDEFGGNSHNRKEADILRLIKCAEIKGGQGTSNIKQD